AVASNPTLPEMNMPPRLSAAAVLFAAVLPALPAHGQELALKRVLLSSGGVGYFEHEAQVQGDATLNLEIPLAHVDDVLKSIVVFDDTGRIGSVTLPGREPLAYAFRDLSFPAEALDD